MLNAGQVAERLNISKGYAYKVIREMNDEQEALGRPVVKGRVRSITSSADTSRVMKMPVYKSENGTYYVQCFYRDGRGAKRHKVKGASRRSLTLFCGRRTSEPLIWAP